MKTLRTPQLRALILCLAISTLPGCFFPEDKGTVENVGTPVPGEGDFTVNPPSEPTEPTEPPDDDGEVSIPPTNGGGNNNEPEFFFSIDQNRPYSFGETLTLSVETLLPTYLSYKISPNANCEGGTWAPLNNETLQATVPVTDFTRNSNVTYSVRFRDVDATPSACLTDSIIHDNKGPDILFTKYPMTTLEEGATGEIIAQVTDVSPIISVECRLNNISRSCLAGTNIISLSAMPAGSYTFTIRAVDMHNYSSTQSVSWTVVNKAKLLTQTVLVKDDRKVDVLIVIDNSGSMQYEQQSMGSRVRNMLQILRGLDYRIAVVTTDPDATRTSKGVKYYGDGDMIPIVGQTNRLWIDSTMDETVAQQALSATLQRPETGSGTEQGIKATYRFVEKNAGVANGFFRDGANFATLVISDEDESANTDKNDPQKLLALIAGKFNSQKAYSWHSIITKPGDTACKSTYGYSYGERYKTITTLTGGILGSVCEVDYAAQVSGIATEIRNLIKNITLSCEPLPGYPITVRRDGVAYTVPYTVEGVNMKFADILDPGLYTVDYACLNQ